MILSSLLLPLGVSSASHRLDVVLAADNTWNMTIYSLSSQKVFAATPVLNDWTKITNFSTVVTDNGPYVISVTAWDYGVISGFWSKVFLDNVLYTQTGTSDTKWLMFEGTGTQVIPTSNWTSASDANFKNTGWIPAVSTPDCLAYEINKWGRHAGQAFLDRLAPARAGTYLLTSSLLTLSFVVWAPNCNKVFVYNYFRTVVTNSIPKCKSS